MGNHHVLNAKPAALFDQHQIFLGGGVARRQDQFVPGDHREDFFDFRQQLPVPRHAGERQIRSGVTPDILGIQRRHPDHAPPASGHLHHFLDCGWIDAAHCAAEADPAEHLQPRDLLAREVSQHRGRFPVALQHQAAHAHGFRQLRDLDPVHGPRLAIGKGVHVDIDDACERPGSLRMHRGGG